MKVGKGYKENVENVKCWRVADNMKKCKKNMKAGKRHKEMYKMRR